MKAFAKIKKSDYVAILNARIAAKRKEIENKMEKEVLKIVLDLSGKSYFWSKKSKYSLFFLESLLKEPHDIMRDFYDNPAVVFATSVGALDSIEILHAVLYIQALQANMKNLEKTFNGLTFVTDDYLYVSIDDLPSYNEALKLEVIEILEGEPDESQG